MFRFRHQYLISFIAGLLVTGILVNNIIVKATQTNVKNLFWLLIAFMLLITFAIYYKWHQKILVAVKKLRHNQPLNISHFNFRWSSPDKTDEHCMSVVIGNHQCSQPYRASVFSIGLKWQHYSQTYLLDNNGNIHDALVHDEDINSFQLINGDNIWQIGPEYTGCCAANGNFHLEKFKKNAARTDVKMIELALSSAKRKPSETLSLSHDYNFRYNNEFNSFDSAEGLMIFLGNLREHSGGKPVGIRIRKPEKRELNEICYAICKTQMIPDFIVVEGAEELSEGIYLQTNESNKTTLYSALELVSKTLEFYKLKKEIVVIAKGKISSGFDLIKLLALGANLVRSVIADCNLPRTKTPKDPELSNFHDRTVSATAKIMNACGFTRISDITLASFFQKLDASYAISLKEQLNHIAGRERTENASLEPAKKWPFINR